MELVRGWMTRVERCVDQARGSKAFQRSRALLGLGRWPRGWSTADRWTMLLLVACAGYCFLYILANYPPTPAVRADSATYLRFKWYRAPGLGLLGNAVYSATGSWSGVVVIQLLLALSATLFFVWTLGSAVNSRVLSLVAGVLFIFHGTLRRMDASLLSESLFVAFAMTAIAFGLRYWRLGQTRQLALASTSVALAMLMRPTGVAAVIPLGLFWIARERRSLRALLIGFAPMLAIVGLWSGFNYYHYARATPFVRGGLVLSAATVQYFTPDILLRNEPILKKHEELVKLLTTTIQPLRKRLRAAQKQPLGKRELAKRTAMLEVFYQRGKLAPIGRQIVDYFKKRRHELCPNNLAQGKPHRDACMDKELGNLAKVAIRGHRRDYLRRVFDSWLWYTETTHATHAFDASSYHGTVNPKTNAWWLERGGAKLAVSSKTHPMLKNPPGFLHVWHQWMRTKVVYDKRTRHLGELLGVLDRWLCLAVLGMLAGTTLVSTWRQRRLTLPSSGALIAGSALYGFYAVHHLLGAAVHPAVDRYTLIIEPFAIAALLTVIVGLAQLLGKLLQLGSREPLAPKLEEPTTPLRLAGTNYGAQAHQRASTTVTLSGPPA